VCLVAANRGAGISVLIGNFRRTSFDGVGLRSSVGQLFEEFSDAHDAKSSCKIFGEWSCHYDRAHRYWSVGSIAPTSDERRMASRRGSAE
jgi:hypothetical protein